MPLRGRGWDQSEPASAPQLHPPPAMPRGVGRLFSRGLNTFSRQKIAFVSVG